MFLYSFYIPTVNESDGTYVYTGEDDPNTIDNWTRNPDFGDEYLQINDNLVQPIRWEFTDNGQGGIWIIVSNIKFFIYAPTGIIVTPNTSVTVYPAFEVGGAITKITDGSTYDFLKLYHNDTDKGYELEVTYNDLSDKYVVQLKNTNNGNILDTIEITPLAYMVDNTPPYDTQGDMLYKII